MYLPRLDRLALISAAPLLLAGFAGCAAHDTQTATADGRPLDTSYGATSYRRPSQSNTAQSYGAPQFKPTYAPDAGYAAEEYPDFRGPRKRFATGDGNPPVSDNESRGPAVYSNEDEAANDSVDRRSFRESLRQKFSALRHRRSADNATNDNAVQPPLAAGAAAAGWDVRIQDQAVASQATTASGKGTTSGKTETAASDTEVFDLDAPLESPPVKEKEPVHGPAGRNLALGIGPNERSEQRTTLRRSLLGGDTKVAAANPKPASSPVAVKAVRKLENPPEWTDRRPAPVALPASEPSPSAFVRSQPAGGILGGDGAITERSPSAFSLSSTATAAEPVRIADPPRLSVPPSDNEAVGETDASERLSVSRMAVCRQVRGYDDVVEIPAQQLRRGQTILIYAAIDRFLSVATATGYRTLTLSTLEIQRPGGDVIVRMPLGTAVDVSQAPRQDFFLTHKVTIPENLPAGEYVFNLRIDDLQSHESSRSEMSIAVTGDHTRPDAAGDTSKFATRPDTIQR